MRAVIVAVVFLVACSDETVPPGAPRVPPPLLPRSVPPTSEPVNSDLAAAVNGGGCYPIGVDAPALDQAQLVDPHWAPVLNGVVPDSEPVLVSGIARGGHGDTGGDYPADHVTPDATLGIELDDAHKGWLATGNVDEESRIELEWEAGSWPAWAWPGEGDGIVALGRWVFDCGHVGGEPGHCSATTSQPCKIQSDCAAPACATCGGGETCVDPHFDYQSELHPPQATASIREGRGAPSGPGGDGPPSRATRADLYVSPDGGPAADRCAMTHRPLAEFIFDTDCYPLSQPLAPINRYDFEVDVPLPARPQGAQPWWRLEPQAGYGDRPAEAAFEYVDAPSPHVHVRVAMSQPVPGGMPTGFGGTLFTGWDTPDPALVHVRVTLDSVILTNPLKRKFPVLHPAPGWHMQASVNGEWQRLADLDDVAAAGDRPQSIVFDQWLPPDAAVELVANGTSRACIDTIFGQALKTTLHQLGAGLLYKCLLDGPKSPGTATATVAVADIDESGAAFSTESEGSDGGLCAASSAPCVDDGDCDPGEACSPSPAFTLHWHAQRIAP